MFVSIAAHPGWRTWLPPGPTHRLAGFAERGALSPVIFGDYVTACGLTLPRERSIRSSVERWLDTPARCGDCFA